MHRLYGTVFAATLILAPLGARAADLVVWWEQGYNPEEGAAVREIIAAFEQDTGKQVELVLPSHDDIPPKVQAAVEAGEPPDFLFGMGATNSYYGQWTYEDRLVDLSDEIMPFASLFDRDALGFATLFNATTGRRAVYVQLAEGLRAPNREALGVDVGQRPEQMFDHFLAVGVRRRHSHDLVSVV
jgi:ABC-type glycerol-3-phosphate transport system substrate-binding protein